MNLTNPYEAAATLRGTGETLITAVVMRVLLRPTGIPEAITAPMTTQR